MTTEPTEAMRLAFTAARGSWFDKMRAALAVASVGGVLAERHVRHLKRGAVYAVLGAATAQVSCGTVPASGRTPAGRILRDDATVVVYVGADGRLWVRFPDEMNDGRFETIAPGDDGRPNEVAEVSESWPAEVHADRPLTALDLADAFGCMWNAAIGAAHDRSGGMDCACVLAEGFAAMASRLEEIAGKKETTR